MEFSLGLAYLLVCRVTDLQLSVLIPRLQQAGQIHLKGVQLDVQAAYLPKQKCYEADLGNIEEPNCL